MDIGGVGFVSPLLGYSFVLLSRELADLAEILGTAGAAKALRVTPRRLSSIGSGKASPNDAVIREISARLPKSPSGKWLRDISSL